MTKITKAFLGCGFAALLVAGCGDGGSGAGGSGGGTAGSGGSGGGSGSSGGGGTAGGAAGMTGGTYPADAMSAGKYVANKITLPSTSTQSKELGCDLDGNGVPDNQLGNILSALRGMIDTQMGIDDAVNTGSVLVLFDVVSKSGIMTAASGQAGVAVNLGKYSSAMFNMATAFSGMGMFMIDGMQYKLGGSIANGVGNFGPGNLTLKIALVAGTAPFSADLISASVANVAISATGLMGGKICGAITEMDLNNKVLPTIANLLKDKVAGGGSTATTLCQLFDTMDPKCAATAADCANFGPTMMPPANCISDVEIRENAIIKSVLKPDVTLNGTKALSLGLGFTAVVARF